MLEFECLSLMPHFMKTAYWIGALVIVLVVIGLIVRAMNSHPAAQTETSSSTDSVQIMSTTTSTTTTVTTPAASGNTSGNTSAKAPAPKHFNVNGNDATADLKVITVAAGTPVTITFGADAGTTYHGGLDYRSSVLNTGTIAPGSTKTVSFTATHSFSFTPYWPATNIAKPYTISIVVQ